MSPSDFGQILKPFVFLDLFDIGAPLGGVDLHPHSGIATLTYVAEGAVSYEDTNGATGVVSGRRRRVDAGRRRRVAWRRGGRVRDARAVSSFGSPCHPSSSSAPSAEPLPWSRDIPRDGPASGASRQLRGRDERHRGPVADQLSCRAAEERRALALSAARRPHGPLVAIGSGAVAVPDELRQGDLAAFEPSNDPVEFEALSDAEFVVGSAVPHDPDLVLGYYSVHTSADALREAEARIAAIKARLVQEGRL